MTHKNSINGKATMKEFDSFYEIQDFIKFLHADKAIISALIEKFNLISGAIILDIGTGTGKYTNYFNHYNLISIGIDVSYIGIKKAKGSYKSSDFILSDASYLPLRRKSFDIIFCHGFPYFNLENLDSLVFFINNLIKVLIKDGIFIFGKTSTLTNMHVSGRFDHSVESYLNFFKKIDCVSIIGNYATIPHFALLLKKYSFSIYLSNILSNFAKRLHLPVRVYIILKKTTL